MLLLRTLLNSGMAHAMVDMGFESMCPFLHTVSFLQEVFPAEKIQ